MNEEVNSVEKTENKELSMKSTVRATPRKPKEVIIFILMILVILSVIVPFVNVLNVPTLILGMPVLMFWSIMIIPIVTLILILAYKWEVH